MRLRRYGVVLAGTLFLFFGSSWDGDSAEEVRAGDQIRATYEIDLAGFTLGEFGLTATFQGTSYELQAKGRFSLLRGRLYSGAGTTKSAGKLREAGPEPSAFSVSYKGGGKKEQRHISFAHGDVSQVSITPRKKPSRRRLPTPGAV